MDGMKCISTPGTPRVGYTPKDSTIFSTWLSTESLLAPPSSRIFPGLGSKSDSQLANHPQEAEESLESLQDYNGGEVSDESEDNNNGFSKDKNCLTGRHPRKADMAVDNEGLILPRKVPNPCLESLDKQALHRELAFNNKVGKDVLKRKTELQKAMERHREAQARRAEEAKRLDSMTPFEKVIEQRAKRLETLERGETDDNKDLREERPEFLQIHDKLKQKMEAK